MYHNHCVRKKDKPNKPCASAAAWLYLTLQIWDQSWAPPMRVKGVPGQLWANTYPSIAPNIQKYPLTQLVTCRHPGKFKSSPWLLWKWRSKSQSESPSLLTDITRDGHGPEKFTAWPFVYTWRAIQFQVQVNMKEWGWRKLAEGYPTVFAPKSMAHGNLLPFLNFKPFLETEVWQKNFLGFSKTVHLCQHHAVLYYLLSRVRRNELLLLRKNINPTPAIALTTVFPLSTPKNCHTQLYVQLKLFSLLTLHRNCHVCPALPTPQAHNSENSPLLPMGCTHLGAEIPSGT